jgi:hypothetical protein
MDEVHTMKIEDATFSVRVKLKEEGIGPDQIQWLEKEGWSISERRGVSVASQKFDPIIDAGWVVLLSVSDAAHFSELLRNFPATIKDEVLVAISVYFAEDECEFSVDESILTICVENKSRLWVHTFPKGDWRT